jgi:hypothetical protein
MYHFISSFKSKDIFPMNPMNSRNKKVLVLLWPVAALLISLSGWFTQPLHPFSLEDIGKLPRFYLMIFINRPLFSIICFTLFILSCAAWLAWRFAFAFFAVLFSALLFGPLGIHLLTVLTFRTFGD